jgi:hypothetical protein
MMLFQTAAPHAGAATAEQAPMKSAASTEWGEKYPPERASWPSAAAPETLKRVVEEAHRFLDLNWGYLDEATREALEPLMRAVEQVRDA